MLVIGYLVFLGVSYLLLLQLFRFTTYHRWFSRAIWALIAFAVISGIVMHVVGLAAFFLWHVMVIAALLALKWRSDARKSGELLATAGTDDQAVKILQLSLASTRAYYWLSTLVYLLVFSATVIVAYNF